MLKKILADSYLTFLVSFLLYLATLPLISIGAVQGSPRASLLGVVALVTAAALPPLQRSFTAWLARTNQQPE